MDAQELKSAISNACAGMDPVQTILILATPSLAKVVEDIKLQSSLVTSVVAERPMTGKKRIRCVSAIVDALPVPGSLPPLFHEPPPPKLEGGEGCAIFLSARSGYAQYSPVSDHEGAEHTSSTKLIFGSNVGYTLRTSGIRIYQSISLPVANTIFINERRSTLIQTVWYANKNAKGRVHPNFEGAKRLDSFEMNMGFWPEEFRARSSTRLQSLTNPRKIVKSMGNVLSQIEVDGSAVPASQELEKAVTAFVESNPESTARGPLLVYALIRPEGERVALDVQNVPNEIWLGNAKLFKVSGGGGGWGARQGLLSLEVAVNSDHSSSKSSGGLEDLLDDDAVDEDNASGPIQKLMSHGVVAGPSTVEFLVYSPALSPANSSRSEAGKWTRSESTKTVVLGTATDPESPDASLEDSKAWEPDVRFVPGHFGMISYHGASLSSKIFANNESRDVATRAESRLDVPDCQFHLQHSKKTWKAVDLD